MNGQESYGLSWRLYDALGSAGFSMDEIKAVISKTVAESASGPKWSRDSEKAQKRAEDMARSYRAGQTLEQIGQEYGVTRERVRQILKQHGMAAEDGGSHVKAQVRIREREEAKYDKKNSRIMTFWGVTAEEMEALNEGKNVSERGSLAMAYRNQFRAAQLRSIPWEFNFKTWLGAWKESGKLHLRGKGRGKYVMGRPNDSGPYAPGNVIFITHEENSRQSRLRDKPRDERDELGLTPRQRQAYDLLLSGVDSAAGIAAAMGICYGTAYSYLHKAKSIRDLTA